MNYIYDQSDSKISKNLCVLYAIVNDLERRNEKYYTQEQIDNIARKYITELGTMDFNKLKKTTFLQEHGIKDFTQVYTRRSKKYTLDDVIEVTSSVVLRGKNTSRRDGLIFILKTPVQADCRGRYITPKKYITAKYHAMALYCTEGKKEINLENSYGKQWGDAGHVKLSKKDFSAIEAIWKISY